MDTSKLTTDDLRTLATLLLSMIPDDSLADLTSALHSSALVSQFLDSYIDKVS